jgi:hypothetical protein
MTLAVTHSTAADGTFSVSGATAWGANHALAGVADVSQGGTGNATWTSGQILYASGTTTLTQSANLSYNSATLTLTVPKNLTCPATAGTILNIQPPIVADAGIGVNISSGVSSGGVPGNMTLRSSDAIPANTVGGSFTLAAGGATGTATGGSFSMSAGNTVSGGAGTFLIASGAASDPVGFGGFVIINPGSSPNPANNGVGVLCDATQSIFPVQWDAGGYLRFFGGGAAGQGFNAPPVYGAPTGAVSRATFDQSTVTLQQLAQRLAALIQDLQTYGQLG